MRSCVESLERNRGKFGALILRDYMLSYLVYHGEWRALTGNCPILVITCDMLKIEEFDWLPGIYTLREQRGISRLICDYFFRWNRRFPGNGQRYLDQWEFSHPPFDFDPYPVGGLP